MFMLDGDIAMIFKKSVHFPSSHRFLVFIIHSASAQVVMVTRVTRLPLLIEVTVHLVMVFWAAHSTHHSWQRLSGGTGKTNWNKKQQKKIVQDVIPTLPETNIGPKNGWLEYYFPIQGPC